MKKVLFIIATALCIALLGSCDKAALQELVSDITEESNIDEVKNSVWENYPSVTIGDLLENYKYFTEKSWKGFTTENGEEIVEFRAKYEVEGKYEKGVHWFSFQFIMYKLDNNYIGEWGYIGTVDTLESAQLFIDDGYIWTNDRSKWRIYTGTHSFDDYSKIELFDDIYNNKPHYPDVRPYGDSI